MVVGRRGDRMGVAVPDHAQVHTVVAILVVMVVLVMGGQVQSHSQGGGAGRGEARQSQQCGDPSCPLHDGHCGGAGAVGQPAGLHPRRETVVRRGPSGRTPPALLTGTTVSGLRPATALSQPQDAREAAPS